MQRCALLFAFGLPLLAVSPTPAQWPGFRGPHRDGVAAAEAKPPLTWSDAEHLRWKTELPGPGSSSPIVFGDRVYVACYAGYGGYLDDGGDPKKLEHHLVCVERDTGEIVWDTVVKGPLEKEARKVQISEHGFASPTPITDDGETIFCYFGRAGVVAIDRDGKQLWQTDLGEPTPGAPAAKNSVERGGQTLSLRWGTAASPLLYENLVIVNCSEESNSIRALDRKTGELVWKLEAAELEGSAISPMLAGAGDARVLVIALGGEVWGLEPRTGEKIWSIDTGTRGGMSPTPVADAELVYAFGGEGKSFAIRYARDVAAKRVDGGEAAADAAGDRVVWTKNKNLDIPSPVLHDGLLFLVDTSGMGVCLEAESGEVVFDDRLEGRTSSVYSSPVLAAGRLYVVSRKRGTFVYSADGKFELLAHNELKDDSQFNASPAIAGDLLLLRSDRYLYCFADDS